MLKGMRAYGVVESDGRQAAVRRGSDSSKRSVVTSSLSSGAPGGNAASGGQVSGVTSMRGNYELGVMEGTIDTKNRRTLMALCRDMYQFDTISGSAIDLMSNLPFSDFTLSGVNDKKILQSFARSCENLRLRKFFPSMSIEYLTDGAHQSTLEWDSGEGIFKSIIAHDGLDVEITELPAFGSDPLLTLKTSERMKALIKLAEKDPRVKKALDNLPAIFRNVASGKGNRGGRGSGTDDILLEPASTVYIARQTYSWKSGGTSYLHRIIPIWLMEKAFVRGTTESVYQRQRPIIHITAGDGVEYEPDDGELANIAELIKGASMDPIGAIIATRPDININEVIRGEDFWKWTDINDQFAAAKLKALGLSDAFLSGDANFSTLEVSLSTFMEQLKAFRDMATREFFYEKMFPSIAVALDYKKSKRDMKVTSEREMAAERYYRSRGELIQTEMRNGEEQFIAICDGSSVTDISHIKDITEYYIPTVDWHKQLGPTADSAYMDVLQQLTERGVPIPIRAIAAAGGMDIDKLMAQMDDDMEIRQELSGHMKKIKKLLGEDEGGGFGEMSGFANSMKARKARKNRNFQETGDTERYRVREQDSRGRSRAATSRYQKQLEENANRKISMALARIADGSARKASRRASRNSPFGKMR